MTRSVGVERPQRAVERAQLLAGGRAAHDHDTPVQRLVVERVQRAAECEHHVVRHVDDVRDRADAGCTEARLEPERRLADLDVAEQAADVARAAVEIIDAYVDLLVAVARRLVRRKRNELGSEERGDLARDAVDGEQIRAVPRRLDVQHLFDEGQDVRERCAGSERVGEQHDPVVIGAEIDLVLGEDHPLRHLTAQLAPLERETVRQRGARKRDRDLRARAEVPRTADDLVGLGLADVDLAELQAVGVRMLLRLEHVPDAEEPEVAAVVADTDTHDLVDLGRRDRQAVGDLRRRRVDVHVLAQPGERDAHYGATTRTASGSEGRSPRTA